MCLKLLAAPSNDVVCCVMVTLKNCAFSRANTARFLACGEGLLRGGLRAACTRL